MPEVRNEVSKLNIRGQLNLIYAMSRLLASILNLVQDNRVARDTLCKTAEGIFDNGETLYDDDKGMVGYTIENVFGNGKHIYDADGRSAGHSIDSIFGNGERYSLDYDAFDGSDDF